MSPSPRRIGQAKLQASDRRESIETLTRHTKRWLTKEWLMLNPELAVRIADAAILEHDERHALDECERLGQRDGAREARRRLSDARAQLDALIRQAQA